MIHLIVYTIIATFRALFIYRKFYYKCHFNWILNSFSVKTNKALNYISNHVLRFECLWAADIYSFAFVISNSPGWFL